MLAKRFSLLFARARVVKVIQPGFSNSNDFLMHFSNIEQIRCRKILFLGDMVGVYANRAPDLWMCLGDRQNLAKLAQAGADRL